MKGKSDLPLDLELNVVSLFKVKVGISTTHGVGLFAVLPLIEDEIVCDISRLCRYPKERTETLPTPIKERIKSMPILIAETNELLIPNNFEQATYWFMNHSIKPNVYFDGFYFRALRSVTAGEELFYNYATLDYYEDFKF